MPPAVEVRTVEPMILAAVRHDVLPGQVGQAWKPALDLVWAFLRGPDARAGLWSGGHNVFLYRAPTNPSEPMSVDFGVQVNGQFEPEGEVRPVQTPAGRAATALHVGPISGLRAAHEAIEAWCAAHEEALVGVSWETYDDWGENPATWETQVTYLLA